MENKISKYKRKTVYTDLKPFCTFAKDNDFMEAIEWKNGEGFDVEISSTLNERFSLTYGEFKALQELIKVLDK